MLRFLICCFVILMAPMIQAEIYQWKDADGKVHYGEKKAAEDQKDATKVEIRDKYHIGEVEVKKAIYYTNTSPHRVISFKSIKLALPDSEHDNIRIGRITCGRAIDLYWQKGVVDFIRPEMIKASISTFSNFGYVVRNAVRGGASAAGLNLDAEIIGLKMNECPKNNDMSQNATYLKIKWTLSDPLSNKTLYTGESAGSHNALNARAIRDGDDISFDAALSAATSNLLADPEFSKSITAVDATTLIKKFDEKVIVQAKYGSGGGSFKAQTEKLMNNTVIVKTKDGFGSGIIIDSNGYLLTNAHVVGDETKFHILIGDNTLGAELVRKEVIRDVALLKINNNYSSFEGVEIARNHSKVGDEIYIIGAPLALENSQTTTRGIVSAYRDMQGLRYLQTDASVNQGSSGGPVFNEHGELIALTVSGLLTKDGAGLGINYLIPIDDAFRYLNLDKAITQNKLLASTDNWLQSALTTKSENAFLTKLYYSISYILNWLDSPLFSLGGVSKSVQDPSQAMGSTQLPDKRLGADIRRAKFAEALGQVTPIKTEIGMYYLENEKWPTDFGDIGVDGDVFKKTYLFESIYLDSGGKLRADLSIDTFGVGQYFELSPDASSGTMMSWICTTNLEKHLWVGECSSF